MIAVQGPQARELCSGGAAGGRPGTALALKPFTGAQLGDYFVAQNRLHRGRRLGDYAAGRHGCQRSGMRSPRQASLPCGLGARDTLRLEAGMNLYGTDMDESTTPLESGLGWTVAWQDGDGAEREFTGADALRKQKAAGVERKFVGLVLEDRGVIRGHQRVVD